jgi:hypothetical protein
MDISVASRPAKVGEKLVTIRFADTASCGFAAVGEPGAAVRLLPGTELEFDNAIRYHHRFSRLRFGGRKAARVRRLSTDGSSGSCDALELSDGRIVMLMQLAAGQTTTVRQVPPAASAAQAL